MLPRVLPHVWFRLVDHACFDDALSSSGSLAAYTSTATSELIITLITSYSGHRVCHDPLPRISHARSSAVLSPKMRLSTLSALLPLAAAYPSPLTTSKKPLPLLIWHGLGDRYDADGLNSVGELAAEIHPGTEVYYIRVSDAGSEDQRGTFFGNITQQSEEICASLADNKNLTDASGVVRADALGFSQGGQFLRGLVERCPALSVRSLVTYGS